MQHTGINFEKYDDISFEVSGNNVSEGMSDVCYHYFSFIVYYKVTMLTKTIIHCGFVFI